MGKAISVLSLGFAIVVIVIFIIIYSSIILFSHCFNPDTVIRSSEDMFVKMNRTFYKI